MRTLSILAVVVVAQVGAAWAIGDMDVARPGGAFSTVEAESAGSCERLCVEDTLCMAWSFHENLCELKAVVPAAITHTGVISGVSQRAPASLREQATLRRTAALEAPEVTAPEAPILEAEPIAAMAEDDISAQLLGGLEDGDLRAGLGN